MAAVTLKPINSILLLSNTMTKSQFADVELNAILKQYQHGDVVPVLDTLTVLTKEKFSPKRNKTGAVDLLSNIKKITAGAKCRFKQYGFAIALCEILEAGVENTGASFCELAKIANDELRTAHESTKPDKPAKLPPAVIDTAEPVEPVRTSDIEFILALLPNLTGAELVRLDHAMVRLDLAIKARSEAA